MTEVIDCYRIMVESNNDDDYNMFRLYNLTWEQIEKLTDLLDSFEKHNNIHK